MCKRTAPKEISYPRMPTPTQLEELVEKAETPEDILSAWEKYGKNANQAAGTLIRWTQLMIKTRGKFTECEAKLLSDSRLQNMMNTLSEHVRKLYYKYTIYVIYILHFIKLLLSSSVMSIRFIVFWLQVTSVWNSNLVTVLRTLWILKLPSTNTVLNSVQTEVLWRMRRLSYKQLGLLVDWGAVRRGPQDTVLVNSALKQLELRWTEIADAKTVSALISRGEYLPPSLMDRLEDKVPESSLSDAKALTLLQRCIVAKYIYFIKVLK